MREILLGSTVIAAFIGGVVALFAPCCISVMLPAYFATSFRRRRALVAMTFVFGLGVATVILPIAFGASALTSFIIGRHTWVFLAGALLMVGLGVAMIAGWKLPLPMPGMQARPDRGVGSVYALGAFSGAASACCAPVLAGVIALSGAAGSFAAATVVGVSYVFGMVVPLFVIALLWDRYDWGESRILKGRTFVVRIFGRPRAVHSTTLAGGVLLIMMGVLTAVLGFSGTAMPREGWQVTVSAALQHYGKVVLGWVDGVPGWITALAVLVALGALAWRAVSQHLDEPAAAEGEDIPPPAAQVHAATSPAAPAATPIPEKAASQ